MDRMDLEGLVEKLVGPIQTPPQKATREPWRNEGAAALRSLAEKGLLEAKDSLGAALVDSLVLISERPIWAPLAGGEGKPRLIAELVMNLDNPGRINQGLKATCTTTCVEIYLARRDPAEYARIVAGLLSQEGRALMRSGEELICDEDVLAPSRQEGHRNPISRVFQAACMEFADGNLDYDNTSDGHYDKEENVSAGLEMGPFETLLSALTGNAWKTTSRKNAMIAQVMKRMGLDTSGITDLERDALLIIEQSAEQGEAVFATLDLVGVHVPGFHGPANLEHAAHKVLLMRIDKGKDEVHYEDPMDPEKPWFEGANVRIHDTAGHCSMPVADFGRLLSELTYRADVWRGQRG